METKNFKSFNDFVNEQSKISWESLRHYTVSENYKMDEKFRPLLRFIMLHPDMKMKGVKNIFPKFEQDNTEIIIDMFDGNGAHYIHSWVVDLVNNKVEIKSRVYNEYPYNMLADNPLFQRMFQKFSKIIFTKEGQDIYSSIINS